MALFAFLDESGEYAYHAKSGKYLVYAGVVTAVPELFTPEFCALRYRLTEQGHCLERFHACDDRQSVRDEILKIITASRDYAIHSIVVRKNRVNPSLYKYGVYSIAYRTMLKYLVGGGKVRQIHIIVDTVPDRTQQTALQRALTARADEVMVPPKIPYSINHHSSSAHTLLQVADYCAWAIHRKWQSGDSRSYNLIRSHIKNEFDIYKSGDKDYY